MTPGVEAGEVPVILADHNIGDEPYCAPGLIDDIAYLDRACRQLPVEPRRDHPGPDLLPARHAGPGHAAG
jgi:hypothetical protein